MLKRVLLSVLVLSLLFPSAAFCGSKGSKAAAKAATEPGAAFSATAAGTIVDSKTKLEWAVGPDEDTTWEEAKSWVAGLTLAGGGWRVPTREELKTLYMPKTGDRNISPVFKMKGWWVWTGEPSGDTKAWTFEFESGVPFAIFRDLSNYGRAFAVRAKK